MYELRILSGLHRGATLPLDERDLVLGASEDADVVLVDPGIEEKHATLSLTDSGWLLSAMDGGLRTADSNQPQTLIDLAPGEFARVGDVWVTVVDQDARWENPPPEPVDEPLAAVGLDEEASTDEPATAVSSEDTPAGEEPVQPLSGNAAEEDKNDKKINTEWSRHGRRAFYVPVTAAAVLCAGAAYAIMSKPETALSSKKIAEHARLGVNAKLGGKPADKTVAAAFDAMNENGAAERPLTPDELKKAFRKRLSDADLLKRFDLTLQDQVWTMQAALDDDEAARFERILAAFVKQHNITFPINARVGSAESMLPFKIRQVISGANASVVTQDGNRLYIGDEYQGVRLVSIQSNRLVFAGKRKIEVKW